MYCKKCGGKVESYASNCPFCGEKVANNNVKSTYTEGTTYVEGVHRSAWKWFWTEILMCIPVLGVIFMIIWAFGSKTKADPTFRNWARMNFWVMVIGVVLGLVLSLTVLPTIAEQIRTALENAQSLAA